VIRYVLAALLAAALVGLAGAALETGAGEASERQLEVAIADVESAAVALDGEELSPPDHPDPQRVVELSLPTESLVTAGVSHLEIEPVADADASVVRYTLSDGTTGRELIDRRIVYRDRTDDRSTEIRDGGTRRLRLVLLADGDGGPVVVVDPPEADRPR